MSQQGDNASKTSKKNTSHGQEDINAIINLDEDEDEEVQFVGVVRPPSVIDLIDLSVSPSTSQAAAAAAAGGAGDSLKTPDSETDASESSSGVTALNPQVIVVDPTAVAPAEAAAAVPTAAATAASASAGAAPVAPALECPICLQTCIHPARLPCGHIFCFLCVKGVAYKNRRCAMCRREIPAEFLDHPQLVNGIDDICTTRATEDGYQWYYEGRNGGWWAYDARTNEDIETAYQAYETHKKTAPAAPVAAPNAVRQRPFCSCHLHMDISSESDDELEVSSQEFNESELQDITEGINMELEGWSTDSSSDFELEYGDNANEPGHLHQLICGQLYIINMIDMTQSPRSDPSRKRKIMRCKSSEPAPGVKGIAGLKRN
ncbi:uncharacterized protein LOC108601005 isoform X3 [Drosophila busckii]|uniref:uncharacterized protein LOC108601005 isoform X3 n=1 Tax=Drosophila busckii TaxID=30019 RepID=UPI00083F1BD8|nr:uncharacterized protein LOC108601005 isoform X3 [Drosophila busckii]